MCTVKHIFSLEIGKGKSDGSGIYFPVEGTKVFCGLRLCIPILKFEYIHYKNNNFIEYFINMSFNGNTQL